MRVVAVAMGFYAGQRRRVGSEFDVPEGFKGSWFVPAAEAPPAEAAVKQAPRALSQVGKGKDAPSDFVSVHAGKGKKGKPAPAGDPETFA
jgi:hypothetical protein